MKRYFILFVFLFVVIITNSQTIKRIASFDNTSSSTSGIIGIGDTAVYEYSWYYHTWLAYTNNGLTRVNGHPVINEIACFNNESVNPSGIYVISDTAVFVYNYYASEWLPITNNGLCRINGKPQISDISGFREMSSGDNSLFVISDTASFYYGWYAHQWYPLSNSGLSNLNNPITIDYTLNNYPNPTSDITHITYKLPNNFNDYVRIALYNKNGQFIKELINKKQTQGEHTINLDCNNLSSGIYFYEIVGKGISQAKKILVVK